MKTISSPSGTTRALLWLQVALAMPVAAAVPSITPTVSLHSQPVFLGKDISLRVTASGTQPLSFQWRRDGQALPTQTNQTLRIIGAQPSDEGDYNITVTNSEGTASSEPFRLYVVPPLTELRMGNFTNSTGFRLPYVYYVPADYRSDHAFPLVCNIHGIGAGAWSEKSLPQGFGDWPQTLALASYNRQATDRAIVVWPTRHTGTEATFWTPTEVGATLELLDQFTTEFNIDTNRIYLGGASGGGAPVINALGLRTNFFAAAVTWSGIAVQSSAQRIKHVPVWVFVSGAESLAADARSLVRTLRAAGGHTIYTEYAAGSHEEAIRAGMACPTMVDWLLAQRRGEVTLPVLSITVPTTEPFLKTGAGSIVLAGSAAGFMGEVARVTWENTTSQKTGTVLGTNLWNATAIPLLGGRTNIVVVTATMNTTWAPAHRGTTTFNDAFAVHSTPVQIALSLELNAMHLSWSGGAAPFQIQRSSDLVDGSWIPVQNEAASPVALSPEHDHEFYRVLGR